MIHKISVNKTTFVHVRACVCQVVCVGSMAELEELTGVKVTDLHRER